MTTYPLEEVLRDVFRGGISAGVDMLLEAVSCAVHSLPDIYLFRRDVNGVDDAGYFVSASVFSIRICHSPFGFFDQSPFLI